MEGEKKTETGTETEAEEKKIPAEILRLVRLEVAKLTGQAKQHILDEYGQEAEKLRTYVTEWQKEFNDRVAAQSRAIDKVDGEIKEVATFARKLKESIEKELLEAGHTVELLERRVDEVVKRAAEDHDVPGKAQDALTRLEILERRLDELYGKKLDALGTQVAGLVTIGKRVASVEARCGGYDGMLTKVQLLLEELQKSTDQLIRDIETKASGTVPVVVSTSEADVPKAP